MNILYRGPSIDVSYQVSVYLANRFQRRRFSCEKFTDDGQWTLSNGKSLKNFIEIGLKIKGNAGYSMIQRQQVSKGLFLHQIYCNQVKLENHN
jgi:5-carboxymethyl-2-hydroxymuconate isomerase